MLIKPLQPVSLLLFTVAPTILQVGTRVDASTHTSLLGCAEWEQSAVGFLMGIMELICVGAEEMDILKWEITFLNT